MFLRNRSVRAAITNGGIIARKKDLISKSVAKTGPCPIDESFFRANAESERACLCTFIQNHPAKLSFISTSFFRVHSSRVRRSSILVSSLSYPVLYRSLSLMLVPPLSLFLSHLFLPFFFFPESSQRCLLCLCSSLRAFRSIFDPFIGRALSHGSISSFPFMDTQWVVGSKMRRSWVRGSKRRRLSSTG